MCVVVLCVFFWFFLCLSVDVANAIYMWVRAGYMSNSELCFILLCLSHYLLFCFFALLDACGVHAARC